MKSIELDKIEARILLNAINCLTTEERGDIWYADLIAKINRVLE